MKTNGRQQKVTCCKLPKIGASLSIETGVTIVAGSGTIKVQAAILLVGEYPPLLATRAQLLSDWEVVTTGPLEAPETLKQRQYDLIIFCQSVRDAAAEKLIQQATELHANIKVLALAYDGEERRLPGSATLRPDLYRPAQLRDSVAKLLNGRGDDAL
jgi:hypothetical protein